MTRLKRREKRKIILPLKKKSLRGFESKYRGPQRVFFYRAMKSKLNKSTSNRAIS